MIVRPRLLITMGDVAGIGPEIIARAWPHLCRICRPVVVGDPSWMRWAVGLVQLPARVRCLEHLENNGAPRADTVEVLRGTSVNLGAVQPGQVSAAAGRAAYDFLCRAIDLTLAGAADGIVTAPLHKEGLHAAGLPYPGHTEILAERTGAPRHSMALYLESEAIPRGLAVAHVTLHCALRNVVNGLSIPAIVDRIELVHGLLRRLGRTEPRVGVAGLNPHASDGGLFGTEERQLIQPAVEQAQTRGIAATGPWPSDTLFVRAQRGEFDGIVAMYHDQGHIPIKLLGGMSAVNITLGLPLVRTSVAHGTAYDIAGRGRADPHSLLQATAVAARLVRSRDLR